MQLVSIFEYYEYSSFNTIEYTEVVVGRCSVNKMFLKILQNSQENTCAEVSFLIKLQAWRLQL